MANVISKLEDLGFSPNEAKVYSSLLKVGQTSAGSIIKKTNLHRSVVYETLEKLIDRKLVFKLIKKNISYFQPTDPERILRNLKSKEEIAKSLIPDLKDLFSKKSSDILIYEGVEEYRKFWLDSLEKIPKGGTDYVSGSIGDKWWEYMGEDGEIYNKRRIKKQIKWKMIIFDKNTNEMDLNFLKEHPKLNEFRIIKRDKATKEGNFNIFEDKSVVLHSAIEPLIIEIENPGLVKVFQNTFDILWGIGKKV